MERLKFNSPLLLLCVTLLAVGLVLAWFNARPKTVLSSDAATKESAGISSFDPNTVNMRPQTVALLGTSGGFIAKSIAASQVKWEMNASKADGLLLTAEEFDEGKFSVAKAALAQHKVVIVDSMGSPEGRKAVGAVVGQLLGMDVPYSELDGAVVAGYSSSHFSVTPIEHPEKIEAARKKEAADAAYASAGSESEGDRPDNSAINVLALHPTTSH